MLSREYLSGRLRQNPEGSRFLRNVRAERDLVLSLTSLGITPKQAFELISDPIIGQAQTEDDPGDGLVDASDRLEGGEVITWWNDIEKDKRWVWPRRPTHEPKSIPDISRGLRTSKGYVCACQTQR